MTSPDKIFQKRQDIIKYIYNFSLVSIAYSEFEIILSCMRIELFDFKKKNPSKDISKSERRILELENICKQYKTLYFNTQESKEKYIRLEKDYCNLLNKSILLSEENEKLKKVIENDN